jgi:putative transposase
MMDRWQSIFRMTGGSRTPILIPKHERRFTSFDDEIIAMYARSMTVREIRAFLVEQYGTEASPEFINSVTNAVMDEVTAWQNASAKGHVPGGVLRRFTGQIREYGFVRNKAVHLA